MQTIKKNKRTKQISLTEIYKDYIAGVAYGDYQLDSNLKAGVSLSLVWEPSNKFDKNAIKILHGKYKLGYIKREHTGILHEYRETGDKLVAKLQSFNKNNVSYNCLMITIWAKSKVSKEQKLSLT